MKERPILFSAPMVRAILGGRKTQTRRAVKPQPASNGMGDRGVEHIGGEWFRIWSDPLGQSTDIHCKLGQAGSRLRVKEAAWMWCEKRPNGTTKTGRPKWHYVPLQSAPVIYVADHPKKPETDIVSPVTKNTWGWRFKVGRFLPKWASRITLEITGVRVERLNDISEEDAMVEGLSTDILDPYPRGNFIAAGNFIKNYGLHKDAYRDLWESINGPGLWAANPWVWVITFRRIRP